MTFQSGQYVVFLTAIFVLHWIAPRRLRNGVLLAASLLFCALIHPWFVIPLAASVAVNFWSANLMTAWPHMRRHVLTVAISANVVALGVFKYHGFFVENVYAVLQAFGIGSSPHVAQIVMPVGISFYTFSQIGYLVDVFRGQQTPCRDFVSYALFVTLFAHLVSGPISRAGTLLPQIDSDRRLQACDIERAFHQILWGYFQKLVIADNVGVVANKVFALHDPPFPVLWAGILAFTIQIYADFAGYTDIARGSAALFGFDLPRNFRHPYLARSPIEFWRRWHITLSQWVRDYIYIPLGGSRVPPWRVHTNIMITFAMSGLWHGAGWNYVLWGVYWGLLLVGNRLVRQRSTILRSLSCLTTSLSIGGTFSATLFGWLLFRETNFRYLARYLCASPLAASIADYQVGVYYCVVVFVYSLPLLAHAVYEMAILPGLRLSKRLGRSSRPARTVVAATQLIGILMLGNSVGSDFIYFQF